MSDKQIYSATYSNVPVFEFVTDEGPIMRRKSDSWINATHILKIAKFPKAKRTRILEKDVQTGIHEKVQGGYGKYQGTYIPLSLGIELANSFGVYDELKPIFEFNYVEGKSTTPPPAPKHNHASASNVAHKQPSANDILPPAKKSKSTNSVNDPPRKRGRPKRVNLNQPPALSHSDTTPIDTNGPSIGTFKRSASQLNQGLPHNRGGNQLPHPHLSRSQRDPTNPNLPRQDTEQDALHIMANNMAVKNEDIELADNSSDDMPDNDEVGFLSGRELFGTPKDSFERIVSHRNLNHNHVSSHDPYGLSQYHNPHQNNQLQSFRDESIYQEYFSNLLNFFLEDNNKSDLSSSGNRPGSNGTFNDNNNENKTPDDNDNDNDTKHGNENEHGKIRSNDSTIIPKKLLNPPHPLHKININQAIDNDGNTIFHWACSMANHTIIEFLLANFPNLVHGNLKNHNGETPLMFLIKFSNSYQLKNFPHLLSLLFDSILVVDNFNKTVLHHIAMSVSPPQPMMESSFNGNDGYQLQTYLKNKERVGKYYMECLFTKIVEFQEADDTNDDQNLLWKFINIQDCDGNTAFHIISYNLNKKLIKVFINHHKYINFGIKNLVNYTVEEYLASHNYVLKLQGDGTGEDGVSNSSGGGGGGVSGVSGVSGGNSNGSDGIGNGPGLINTMTGENDSNLQSMTSFNVQSFESQLHYSKMAVQLTNNASNLITEKLTELSYIIDKELNEKDEKILKLISIGDKFNQEKLTSQKVILKMFNLEYLIKDIEQDLQSIDLQKDKIIQEEINRLVNDLTFQILQKLDKLTKKLDNYKKYYYQVKRRSLLEGEQKVLQEATSQSQTSPETSSSQTSSSQTSPQNQFNLAVNLQQQIKASCDLSEQLTGLQVSVPSINKDDFKENSVNSVSNYGDDRLNKYCKLISLCCGMNVEDVEKSIDSIEQSLMR